MTILSPPQIAGYAKAAGFTGSQIVIMTAIAMAESGGNSTITSRANRNGTRDHGLWQINDGANADIMAQYGDWRDPLNNAKMARAIYKRQGYQAWSVFNSGSYSKYLSTASKGAGKAIPPSTTGTPPSTGGTTIPASLLPSIPGMPDAHMWLRVAMFLAGMLLVGIALQSILWANTPDSIKTGLVSAAKVAAVA